MHFASLDLRDPVFEAFGLAFSVQVVTLANVYGVDLAQTSAREEEPDYVVRSAGLAFADQPERAPGAVVLRIEREAQGKLRVRLRAKAPEPIRCTRLLLRGLATPLEVVECGEPRGASAVGEILARPKRLWLPLVTLRCDGELLAVHFEHRRVREMRFAVAIERTSERAGRGVLELVHEADASRAAREHAAPACVIARGDAVAGMREAASEAGVQAASSLS